MSLWLLHLLICWWDKWKVRCYPHSNQTAKSTTQWERFWGPVRDPSWVSSSIPPPSGEKVPHLYHISSLCPPGTPAHPLDKRPSWLAGEMRSSGCCSFILQGATLQSGAIQELKTVTEKRPNWRSSVLLFFLLGIRVSSYLLNSVAKYFLALKVGACCLWAKTHLLQISFSSWGSTERSGVCLWGRSHSF